MEQKGEGRRDGTGMKVLIVDDKSQNLYLLEILLKSAGYNVVMAKNGTDALEKLRASRFDGIISDLLMPAMDGFQLIRECKKDPVLRQIPFIIYTATFLEQKDEEFGLSLGALRYLLKPTKPEELLRQIHEAFLEHARKPRDYTQQPVLDDTAFNREYSKRVGAKLEKKEWALRESEEKYRLLYENTLDAILLTSPDGGILSANPAACATFQRTEEEIIRNGRACIVDPTDPRLPAALEERRRTGRFIGELTFLRKDGTRFPGEISTHIFTDSHGQTLTSMIIRDISERKNQERALQIAKQKLDLMNIVAWHDIHNKVTGLRGYVDLIRNHVTDKKAQEYLRHEVDILEVIHHHILSIREYQQIGERPPGWQSMRSLLTNIRTTGVAGRVRIISEAENLEILVDPVFEKVFWHLVDNSVKHGETVTEIRISAHESASGCTVVYEDNGAGIPEDMKKDLLTKKVGIITGFGLFFVHDILDIHGMTIIETGEPGKGARFEITVPKGTYRIRMPGV